MVCANVERILLIEPRMLRTLRRWRRMMLVKDRRNRKFDVRVTPGTMSKSLVLQPGVSKFVVQLVDLHQKLLPVVTPTCPTSFPSAFKVWKQGRAEQAREKKSKGESQYERYDAFEKSGVQHKILTCFKEPTNDYGANPDSVSPLTSFLS